MRYGLERLGSMRIRRGARARGQRPLVVAATIAALVLSFATLVEPSVGAPAPPTLLIAQALDDRQVEVQWTAVDGAASYVVYRDDVAVVTQAGTLYRDTTVQPATTYRYEAAAIIQGVATTRSPAVYATTEGPGDSTAPSAPPGLKASAITATSLTLRWNDSSDNGTIVAYRILFGPAGTPAAQLAPIGIAEDQTRYVATKLSASTAYRFGVAALDLGNNVSSTSVIDVTTASLSDNTPPVAVSSSSVTATAFSSSRIDIIWGASTSTDVASYQILRNDLVIGNVSAGLRKYFSDNGLAPNTTYTYKIRAVDSRGNLSSATTGRNGTTLTAGTVKIVRGPFIQSTTGTSARITWWTNIPAPSTVSYGIGTPSLLVGESPNVQQHVMLIGGLQPGSTYAYTVTSGAVSSGPWSFTTARSAGSTYTFSAVGDFGGGSAQGTSLANLIGAGGDFVLTVGDNVYPDSRDPDFEHTYWDFDHRFFKPYAVAFRQQTAWLAGGNHEYYGDEAFWRIAWLPNNERWYSYDWGNAHFLVLDSEQPFGPGTPQGAFAAADLAANQSDAWRIVVVHRPPYSSTSANSSSSTVRADLVPLLEQQNVDLVLTGHSHNYERTYPLVGGVPSEGGVTYVVSGGGGNGLNQFTIPQPSWSAHRQAIYQYLRITVSSSSLQVDARDQFGAVFDSFTLGASPDPSPSPSPTPSPSPSPSSVFGDGFESGTLSAWTSSAGLIVQSAEAASGQYAAEGNTTNGSTWAKKTLPGTYADGYFAASVNVLSTASQVNLLRIRTAGDVSLGYLYVTKTGQLMFRNDLTAEIFSSASSLGPGWHRLELHAVVNGASGAIEVWLDGSFVGDLSRSTDLGSVPIGRAQIGEVYAGGRIYDVVFDDVAFATSRIGP